MGMEDDLLLVEIFNKLQSCPLYQLLLEHALSLAKRKICYVV